ncbi:MerR family transcriptional regulator [Furfurilactobacillus curtus]|uniref:MerR family transcriptional regulator n=1 Tax=Furfurilactobacillus curtus TaxID=1746200 RepID=A0ABQ5JR06_9LACO
MHSIREVADQFNITYDTLRYYEKEGLLRPINRDSQGRRVYSSADIDDLNRLIHLRHLGASIAESRQMMSFFHSSSPTIDELNQGIAFLNQLNKQLDHRLTEIQQQKIFLDQKVTHLNTQRSKLLSSTTKPNRS